jgi:acetylornithine deacetylase/succinyl-diaminopimelate desuccinylase-like protein
MSYDEKILQYMDLHRKDILTLEEKLIQTKSLTGDEFQVAELVAEECKKDGLSVELVEPTPKRVSVVAKYKGTTGRANVMWYSHYDTLPPGDENEWKHAPFSAAIESGWIYGRGADDNKTATCASIIAFRAVKNLGIKLKGDLVFTHVADEEKGGSSVSIALSRRGTEKVSTSSSTRTEAPLTRSRSHQWANASLT